MKLNLTTKNKNAGCPSTRTAQKPTPGHRRRLRTHFPGSIRPPGGCRSSVSITNTPNPASVGSNLVYTITVTNAGPDTATGVILTNQLSEGQVVAGGGPAACPSPGPVAWWKGEGNANDSAGSNNGTLIDNAAFAAGRVGQAFSLDGDADYVSFPDAPALRPASFTVEGWFKLDDTVGTQVLVSKTFGAGTLDSFAVVAGGNTLLGLISDTTESGDFSVAPAPLSAGVWYHIAFTFDDTTKAQILYVNGVAVDTRTINKTVAYDNHPVLIGCDIETETPDFFMDGLADEVTLFDRQLSASDILAIYNNGSAGKCSASTSFAIGDLASETAITVTLTVIPTICSGSITNIAVVTTTATDPNPANNQATNAVIVMDFIKPTITCPAAVLVDTDAGVCTASGIILPTPITSDNCGVASVTSNAPSIFPIGITTVTWTVSDNNGNTATCEQIVTVEDNEDPTIACPANIMTNPDGGLCTASGVVLGSPTVGDNCMVATISSNAPAVFSSGTTMVTWTVTDAAGNTATCVQNVTVADGIAPSITCPPDRMVNTDPGQCGATLVLVLPMVGDNCGVASVTSNAPAVFPTGLTTVRWTVFDNAGNSTFCDQSDHGHRQRRSNHYLPG